MFLRAFAGQQLFKQAFAQAHLAVDAHI
jgi:hypothetical protein